MNQMLSRLFKSASVRAARAAASLPAVSAASAASVVLLLAAASLSTTAQAQVTGSVQAGEGKAAMCIGCHGIPGYQNSFPEIHKVPMISGQTQQYLVNALLAYQKGDRRHPSMRGIAGSLSEQDMADLAAFYAQQAGDAKVAEAPSRPAPPAVAALLDRGACMSCHGANFSSPLDPSYPKIGGQHADYLFVALRSYTVQGNNVIGRNNGIMGGIAAQYTPAELRAMANYLGSIEGELRVVPQPRFRK
jgi:cytochrome c553